MSSYRLQKESIKNTIHSFANEISIIKHLHSDNICLKIDQPLELKEKKYKVNPKSDWEVIYFATKMETKYPCSTLNTMYYNLRKEIHNSSYLELLKLAATNKYGNQVFCGFAHASKTIFGNNIIGNGLNTGYTSYLAIDLFGATNIKSSNVALRECMDIIVKVVGRDKLDKYYFKNNLKQLRNDLAKYSSYSAIDSFIIDMDTFVINQANYKKIINYLDILYRNKLREDLDSGLIDYDYVEEELEYLKNQLIKIENIAYLKENADSKENEETINKQDRKINVLDIW